MHKLSSLWKELHYRAQIYHGVDDNDWINQFQFKLPSDCDCYKSWPEILKNNPPRWDDYFAWTVEVHNTVNAKLGKPILTLEEAQEIWLV